MSVKHISSFSTSSLVFECTLVFVLMSAPGIASDRYPLSISKVGFDRKSFDPSRGEKVKLHFEINKQANVQLSIYDRLDREVYHISMANLGTGRHSITWDGRKKNSKLAPGNVFLYTIKAITNEKEKTVYNPAERTGGLAVNPHTYTFDKKTGTVEYVLPKACMIRLRAGLKDGMLARTIIDWEPRTAGRHIERWDGKDVSGLMYLSNHPDLNLNLTCYTLPDNTIITTGSVKVFELEKKSIRRRSEKQTDLWARKGKYLHYTHNPRICHEPRFTISFPGQKKNTSGEIPTLSGTTPIRVELDERDAHHLINKRFEIMLFVDNVYLFEMEEGSSPFTYYWNTKGFAKGHHVVTVNVMSYDDHIGVENQKVIIGE